MVLKSVYISSICAQHRKFNVIIYLFLLSIATHSDNYSNDNQLSQRAIFIDVSRLGVRAHSNCARGVFAYFWWVVSFSLFNSNEYTFRSNIQRFAVESFWFKNFVT